MSHNILRAFSPIRAKDALSPNDSEEAQRTDVTTSPMVITPGDITDAKENERVFDAKTPINPRKLARTSPRRQRPETKSARVVVEDALAKETLANFPTNPPTNPPSNPLINGLDVNAVRNVVREELEELRQVVQRDIRNLHVDMLKGNTILERSIERMLARHLPAIGDVLRELEEVRRENKRLKLRLGL